MEMKNSKNLLSLVTGIDENHLLYGNYIGLQYAFKTNLNTEILAASVSILVHQFPAIAGVYCSKTHSVRRSTNAVALNATHQDITLGQALKASERPQFVFQPARTEVLRGQAPLSSFTLTHFKCGGVIFGAAISHLFTDAAGHLKIMKHLADIYTALIQDNPPPAFPLTRGINVFNFGTLRTKAQTLLALKARGLPKPIPISGILGSFIKPLIIRAMDKSLELNPPIAFHFSKDDVARLKSSVLRESGEAWISTDIALCAHFTAIIAKLSFAETLKTEMQIGQLHDLRNRYFEEESETQSNLVGNAILIHIERAYFPHGLQKTSRGDLGSYFKNRKAKVGKDDIQTRLDLLADCLRHGYTNPELDVKNPIISLNNQSKIRVYDVKFDGQHPADIIPQDVGDNIMFFPAKDGGIKIYIRDIVNPLRQQNLLEPKWQKQVFDF